MEGEAINRERHRLRNDAKAVTMHMFGVKREGGLWKATVVLDI
jgi:SHS2 domain-containing protein